MPNTDADKVESWVVVEQQRPVFALVLGEGPARLVEEGVVLRVDSQRFIVMQEHALAGAAPGVDLVRLQLQALGQRLQLLGTFALQLFPHAHGAQQMLLGHAVGVEVVVDQRGVFVGAGDFVDAERAAAARIEVTDLRPDARGFEHDLGAAFDQEIQVAGRIQVQAQPIRDRGIDVIRGRTRWVVRRAFAAGDRAPREQRAVRMIHLARVPARRFQREEARMQHRARDLRRGVGHHRQHEGFGVPEIMALVAFAGQALGGGAVDAVASGRLQQMEQVETQRLFGGGIAVDEQFRAVPELRQRRGLTRGDRVEAVRHRLMQGLRGMRGQIGRVRVGVGGVDDELLDRRLLSGLQLREVALGDVLGADL
ncbi:MAG: hypothetical protein JF591_15135, partial [Lysobacter sp.]|nr:hypothetical protein [Lysobacter sp.]